MATKRSKTPASESSQTSRGTVLAAQIRATANNLSDERRQELLSRGMQLIYGGGHGGKVTANRR
jgi:CHASE3 domain sensor protein